MSLVAEVVTLADGDINNSARLWVVDAVRFTKHQTLFGTPVSNGAMWKLQRGGLSSYARVMQMRQAAQVRIWLLRQLAPHLYDCLLLYAPHADRMLIADGMRGVNAQAAAAETRKDASTYVVGIVASSPSAAWRQLVETVVAEAQAGAQAAREGAVASAVGVYIAKAIAGEDSGGQGVPNPAYTDWVERRDSLSALVRDMTSGGSEGAAAAAAVEALAKFTRDPAPPRTLALALDSSRSLRCGRVAHVERVGEVCKCLSTLYLRQADMRLLRGSIDLYASRGDDMRALGLPHKLGILLHGEPGTGKSSTIAAIATHLHKDIYYLHLGGVRRNDDLRMLFEHVTRNCANGGVVVMEDIDAMAPVVLRREGLHRPHSSASSASSECSSLSAPLSEGCGSSSLVDLMDAGDAPLTLDYFLNLLQGTLTVDGMVFIATTNRLEVLDPAFYRPGRYDVVLHLGACDRDQVQMAFQRFMGRSPAPDVLARIKEGAHTPASIVARLAQFVCTPADGLDDANVLAPFLD
jgi:hypothetical protein